MRFESKPGKLAGLILLVGIAAGCATGPEPADSDASADSRRAQSESTSGERLPQASASQEQQFRQALSAVEAGELERAQELLEQLTDNSPQLASAQNNLGIVYRSRGQFEKARDAYQAALDTEPDNAKVHLNLGILYDIYLQQPAQALTHYQRYQALSKESDQKVELWIADLERRL